MNRWLTFILLKGCWFVSSTQAQTLQTEKLELLIGQISAFKNGQLVYHHPQFIHVKEFPLQFESDNTTLIDSINFQLGVDSLQHEMGTIDNGLTPINGMYWAWQSGYIFVKWEGFIQSTKEKEREMQPFTFHLGGFQYPFRCDQNCAISLKKTVPLNTVRLSFEPTEKLIQFVLSSDFEIMSPQPAAVQMMKLFSQCLIVQ